MGKYFPNPRNTHIVEISSNVLLDPTVFVPQNLEIYVPAEPSPNLHTNQVMYFQTAIPAYSNTRYIGVGLLLPEAAEQGNVFANFAVQGVLNGVSISRVACTLCEIAPVSARPNHYALQNLYHGVQGQPSSQTYSNDIREHYFSFEEDVVIDDSLNTNLGLVLTWLVVGGSTINIHSYISMQFDIWTEFQDIKIPILGRGR